MKKITIIALLLLACVSMRAQVSYEGATDYGVLTSIVYDQATEGKIYATTQGNHIVASYDNGETWDLLFTYPNSVATITGLKVLPGNENLCFSIINSGTDDGIYIYSIVDGAIINQITLPDPELTPYISSYDIYDADATTILLNIYNDSYAVYYTSNSGENWNEVYDSTENGNISVNNVAISPANPSKLFIARGLSPGDVEGGLLISTDAGENWSESVPGVAFDPIAFNPTNADDIIIGSSIAFGSFDENVYRSTDGGETWDIVPIEWNEGILNSVNIIKFHPTIPGTIIILEENEIVSTDDNGATWTDTVYEYEDYNYGTSLSFNPFDGKEAVLTGDGFTKRTTNGGLTLSSVKSPFFPSSSVAVTKFGTTEHLYYIAQGGHLHKDYATGVTNAYNIQPVGSFGGGSNQTFADPTTEGRIFVYGSGFIGPNLTISTDHGATETTIYNDGNFSPGLFDLAVAPSNHNIVYISINNFSGGQVMKLDITDIASVVTTEIITPGDSGRITGIIVDAADADHLIITKESKIYESTDGGENWDEIFDAEATINSIAKNPLAQNELAIGTDEGVYLSTDNGQTWDISLEDVAVGKVKYSDLDNGVLVAGIYNNGEEDAYITYYNGAEWLNLSPDEFGYLQAYIMDFNFVEGNINAYVGSVDMGVIRYSFPIQALGIDTPSAVAKSITVSPNPASAYVTVTANNSVEIKNVAIYSIAGQKVMETSRTSIDVSALSKGIYIVRTTLADGNSVSQKLIRE